MNYDLLENIFNFIDISIGVYNFRILNKDTNNIFIKYFKKIKVDIFPRTTFINHKECFICYNKESKINKILYNYDLYPHKLIIHCNNKYCNLMSIKRYLLDIKKNSVYPFCYINKNNIDKFKSKNKLINNFYIENLRKYNNKWYIKYDKNYIDWTTLGIVKYIKINNIDYIENINLFSWFLLRSKNLF